MSESRTKTFSRVLSHLKRHNKAFHVSLDMGPRRKHSRGRTVNCLCQFGAKRLGSFGGYVDFKLLVTPKRIYDISKI